MKIKSKFMSLNNLYIYILCSYMAKMSITHTVNTDTVSPLYDTELCKLAVIPHIATSHYHIIAIQM